MTNRKTALTEWQELHNAVDLFWHDVIAEWTAIYVKCQEWISDSAEIIINQIKKGETK